MTEIENPGRINPINVLVAAATVAILFLSIAASYSAWVSSGAHRNSCNSRKATADTLHGLVVLAFTPAPGKTLTSAQVTSIQAFEGQAFPLIDQIKC